MSADETFKLRKENSLDHLFDGSLLNVYEQNIVNLGVGAPGPDLLNNCTSIFQEATRHRMVRYKFHFMSCRNLKTFLFCSKRKMKMENIFFSNMVQLKVLLE